MLKRILVGPGGTDDTVAAINQAVSLAMAHDAELTGVSVIDPSRVAPVAAMPFSRMTAIYQPRKDKTDD